MAVGTSRQICFHAGRELFIERSERAVNALAHATTTNARAVPYLPLQLAYVCTKTAHCAALAHANPWRPWLPWKNGGRQPCCALLSAHRATAQMERLGEQSDGLLHGLDEAIGAQRRSVVRPAVPLCIALECPKTTPRAPQHYP